MARGGAQLSSSRGTAPHTKRGILFPAQNISPPVVKHGFLEKLYPLVNIQKTMEHHHAIHGKTHDFDCDWAIFKFANCNKLPEAISY